MEPAEAGAQGERAPLSKNVICRRKCVIYVCRRGVRTNAVYFGQVTLERMQG